MAVMMDGAAVTEFAQWYEGKDHRMGYGIDERDGSLDVQTIGDMGQHLWRHYTDYKREMDARVHDYETLEKLADGEVISPKPDLPNISSGETSGLVRRIARNLVQNTPNVEVICQFEDSSMKGIFARHLLTSKIIGSDEYSNDMQQNLFASVKSALTLGFQCVLPVLLQDPGGGWYMKYDSIHYRDVFPEPGCKDIRDSSSVFIRRYLTRGEIVQLIRDQTPGWDHAALKTMLKSNPGNREEQSTPRQIKKRKQIPQGYEVITWYSNSGQPFLTFDARSKFLLRIEKNKHPLRHHPVHFLVLEKDDQQPLGKSQVELLVGRQDFQDLMLNGAMKLWYRNINPSIIGYGTVNAIPNLSPGKYTQISNPNAKVEPFEVNTQTLMQYSGISKDNLGSMVSMIGAADQQMAQSGGGGGQGMSATPQGVEAQQQMVDITTNNYQKAIEQFFSHYCSYSLTMYFQELKAVQKVRPTAEARAKLLDAGLDPTSFNRDGSLEVSFEEMAVEYWVRAVPGSLVEMEDEKQMRILNQLFVPLSQAMPALANSGDPKMLQQASAAMQYIIQKQIELSGSSHAESLSKILSGEGEQVDEKEQRADQLESAVNDLSGQYDEEQELHASALVTLQQQVSQLAATQQLLLEKLGVVTPSSTGSSPETEVSGGFSAKETAPDPNVVPASA